MLLSPATGDKDIQLVSADNYPLTVLTLNEDLHEIRRVVGKVQFEPFTRNMAYRLPDQSLIFFGFMAGVAKYPNQQSAAMMKIDPALQHASTLNVSPAQDSADVWFALPLPKPGEFVCERWVNPFNRQEEFMKVMQSPDFQKLDRTQQGKVVQDWHLQAEKRSGIALDFVTTK